MNTKTLLLLSFSLFLAGWLPAQDLSFKNVNLDHLHKTGTIYEGDLLLGYYYFYEQDNEDKNVNIYHLEIMDSNNQVIKSLVLKKEGKPYLLDMAFNGTTFAFAFVNRFEQLLEIETYDRHGQKLAKNQVKEFNFLTSQQEAIYGRKEKPQMGVLFPIANQGFVVNNLQIEKKSFFSLNYFPDDKTQTSWTNGILPEKETHQFLSKQVYTDTELITVYIKRKNPKIGRAAPWIIAQDLSTGKINYQIAIGDSEAPLSINRVFTPPNQEPIVIGFYLDPKTGISRKGNGMYFARLSAKGDFQVVQKYDWHKDFKNLLEYRSEKEGGHLNADHFFTIQDLVLVGDDRIYMIAETYAQSINDESLALYAIGFGLGTKMNEFNSKDFILFEMNTALEIIKEHVLKKEHAFSTTPFITNVFRNYSFKASGHRTSSILQASKGLTYRYLTSKATSNGFSFIYSGRIFETNGEDEKGKPIILPKNFFGVLSFTLDGNYTLKEKQVDTDSFLFSIFPASEGKVNFIEYRNKEQLVKMQLKGLD